jgi:hypothetical protein
VAPPRRRNSSTVRVNFSGVEEEIRKHTQRAAKLPDGDYLVKILDASMRENEDTGARGVNVRAQVVKPSKFKGKTQYGYCSLKKNALWNFRNLINAALGRNVAGKTVDIDLGRFKDKIVGAVIEEDEYEGKVRSRISTWFPREEYEESEDDESEVEDDEEEEEDEYEEEEEDEDEEEEEEPAPRRRGKAAPRSRSKRKRPADEEEDEDLEDVEVEDL